MATSARCLRHEDYTVGWISALPVELAASIIMLDEEHFPLPQDHSDTVVYTLGSIGSHNVVMACLPVGQLGTNSAASVATSMRAKFRHLRFCFLVGIGGGVPSTQDVRLGDIVISQPNQGRGGVIQYDFGKNTPSGFERTGYLNAPPDLLLSALSTYQARNLDVGGTLLSHRFKPRLTSKMIPDLLVPDLLFNSDYDHVGGTTCDGCDSSKLYKSTNCSDRGIMVHYGTIASGNQVLKNGKQRDLLSKELNGILCFEMEAAGIMNIFPCLVIRGICDYADSHKNKDWQPFAARVAAAYGKEILSVIPSIQDSSITDLSISLSKVKILPRSRTSSSKAASLEARSQSQGDLIKYDPLTTLHVSDYDSLQIHWEFAYLRCPGTTQWILEHQNYLLWRQAEGSRCLWLTGKIGSGKTLIASTVIEQLMQDCKDDSQFLLHHFYRHSHKNVLTAMALVNSCIKQLLSYGQLHGTILPPEIESNLRRCFSRQAKPLNFDEVIDKVFYPLAQHLQPIVLVLDGLDECDEKEIRKVLKVIRHLLQNFKNKVLISGRESLDIDKSVPNAISIVISEADVVSDINEYIQWKVEEKMLERRITEDQKVIASIISTLSAKADQMILWVTLQIEDIWEVCRTDANIAAALMNLPKDLNETYDRCIEKINGKIGVYSWNYAAKILPWVVQAVKPFTMVQLQQALAIDLRTGDLQLDNIPSEQDILRSCANLITKNSEQQVVLAHHSVRQFLATSAIVPRTGTTLAPGSKSLVAEVPVSTLAELCIAHLTSTTYSLAVERAAQVQTVRLEPPEISRITNSIPRYIRSFLPQTGPIQFNLPTRIAKTSPIQVPDFFHFARDQWPELTRGVSSADTWFADFCGLVLKQNLTWRIHPWEPFGQSVDSHYFGLLGWSIVHRHRAMFDVLFEPSVTRVRPGIFGVPFQKYDGLNAFLLAARNDDAWAIHTINRVSSSYSKIRQALITSEDREGWNALHFAANNGSDILISTLGHQLRVPNVPNSDGLTPLVIAARQGHAKVVGAILQLPGDEPHDSLVKATAVAIRNGHPHLLEQDLRPSKLGLRASLEISDALVDATIQGHVSAVRAVLHDHAFISSAPEDWKEPILLAAAGANRLWIFHLLIQTWSYFPQEVFVKAVLIAAERGFAIMTQDMLRLVNPQVRWRYKETTLGPTILMAAVKARHCLLVKQLVASRLPLESYGESINIPFTHALQDGQEEIVKALLKQVQPMSLYHSLGIVISTDNLTLARLLIENGPPTQLYVPSTDNVSFAGHGTALNMVTVQGSNSMFRLFLEYPTHYNLFTLDAHGRPPLMVAAKHDCVSKVTLICGLLPNSNIVNKHFILDVQDYTGWTAFHHACARGYFRCAQLLLDYGADPAVLNFSGEAVVHTLTRCVDHVEKSQTNLRQLEPFIKSGKVDIDVRDKDGRTALHSATIRGNGRAITILLELGADVNKYETLQHRTSMHLAAKTTGSRRLSLLPYLQAPVKADPNLQDKNGDTALHLAIEANRLDAVEDLCYNGADTNIRNKMGQTARDLASSLGLLIDF